MRPFLVRRFPFSRRHQPRMLSAVLALALIGFVVPTFVPSATPVQASNQLQVRLGPNGTVRDLTAPDANGVRYMAGDFTAFDAVNTGKSALVDATTAEVNLAMPKIVGTSVKAIISDGNGGFYIGGTFTSVGGVARRNAAHINADGTVNPNWNPSPNLEVKSLLLVGSTVYMGGSFTVVGGLTREYLASVTTGGAMTTWAPQVTGTQPYVNAMIEISGIIYFVGRFTSVEGTSRTGAAAVNSIGALQNWNPNLDQWAWAIVTDGTTIYLGGTFGSAGGSMLRKGLAAFDISGNLLTWNPNSTVVTVNSLALLGSDIYVGGLFSSIGGSARSNLAAFSAAGSGTLRSWAPIANSEVFALAVSGTTIYVGGLFRLMNTSTRISFASIDTSGTIQSWNPKTNNAAGYALLVSGSNIFLGGDFQYAGGVARYGLAAIGADNALTSWAPLASSAQSIVLSGNTVYVGGEFTHINGVARNRLAAIDVSGALLSWNPNANGEVMAMELVGTTMYVSGRFSTIAGVSRTQLAALDVTATATALTTFNVSLTADFVTSILVANGVVYFGGQFTVVSGTTRNNVAAVDISGVLQSWNPNPSSTVYAIAESNGIVYVGGIFNSVGGVTRRGLAAVDTSGVLQSWNPNPGAAVYAIAVNGTHVVLGGLFTGVSGSSRIGIAVVETDGTLLPVNANLANTLGQVQVFAIVAETNSAYFAGNFTSVGGLSLPSTGALNYDGTLNQWNATVSATTTTTLAPNAQTITFGSLTDRVYGATSFMVSATATSNLTVTFSSLTTSVCTIATRTVSVINTGTCTLQADQDGQIGATTWLAAPSVTQSFTVTAKPLTMTGAVGVARDYDGSSTAEVNFSAAQLSGVVGADNVGFSTGSYAAIFSSPAAGTNRSISVSGVTLTGAQASRYTLTQPTVSATINRVSATVTAETISISHGTSFSSSFTNSPLVGSDSIGQMVYTYAGINGTTYNASTTRPTAVGTYSITPSGAGFTSGSSANYSLSYTSSTLTISALSSSITFASLADRIYGVAPITLTATATSGLTVSFSSATPSVCTVNATTLTVINIGVCTVESSQSGNSVYTAASPVSRSFTVISKQISLSGVTGANKNYDSTPNASVNFGSAQLVGVESGDSVAFDASSTTAVFVTAAAGVGKTITVSGVVLTGQDASRYFLAAPTATATINTVPATITLNPASLYVGSSLSHTYSVSGLVGGDSIASMTYTYRGTGSTNYNASTTVPNVIGTYSVTPSAIVLNSGSAASYVVTYTGSTLTIMAPTTTTTVPVDDGESAVGGNVSLNQSPGVVNVTTSFGFILTDAGALIPQVKMRLYIGPISLRLSSTYTVGGKKKTYKCAYRTFGSTKKRPQVLTTYSPSSRCVIPAVLLAEVRAGRATIKATGKITRFWSLNKSPRRPDGSKINTRLINITIKN